METTYLADVELAGQLSSAIGNNVFQNLEDIRFTDGHLEIRIKPGMTYSQWLGVIGWLEVAKALRIKGETK